jgi:VanZ family protein
VGAVCLVVIGELAPGASPLMRVIYTLRVNNKVLHFGAYLVLSLLPVIGFANRRRGIATGVLMALLGVALEGGQAFSPGRDVSWGDIFANNLGVICGLLAGLPLRS